jgi:hypothetical protein
MITHSHTQYLQALATINSVGSHVLLRLNVPNFPVTKPPGTAENLRRISKVITSKNIIVEDTVGATTNNGTLRVTIEVLNITADNALQSQSFMIVVGAQIAVPIADGSIKIIWQQSGLAMSDTTNQLRTVLGLAEVTARELGKILA